MDKTYDDSQNSLDLWYSLKLTNVNILSPDEMSQLVSKVDRKLVIDTANGVYLHTIYKLLPEDTK